MIEIAIPGFGDLHLEHLVLDYNGTIAGDGNLIEGVEEGLKRLAGVLRIHVVTADTFGRAGKALEEVPCVLTVVAAENQDATKAGFVEDLGADSVVSIGNGRNDRLMLGASALGIVVIQEEGAAAAAVAAADVVAPGIVEAFALLENPLRLIATLRS